VVATTAIRPIAVPSAHPVGTASVDLLAAAAQARQEKHPARARTIYQGILARSPDDVDALTGLADLARADGKSSDARSFYVHALIVNPNHGPAILGLADTLWDQDEKDAARSRYRELLRRGSASSYPARVGERAAP
jgi:Tfp pilus assembly protein PilF